MNRKINYTKDITKQIEFTTNRIIRPPQYIIFLLMILIVSMTNKNTKAQSTLPAQHNLQEVLDVSENEEKGVRESGVEKLSKGRPLKEIPLTFSGVKVLLISTNKPLPKEHEIFQQFGEIFLYETKTKYHYLIGKFSSRNKAVEFANKRLVNKYPDYKIAEYIGGEYLEIAPMTVNH